MFVGCVAPFVEPLAAPACVALARVRAVTRGEPFFFRPFLLFLDPCSVWDTTLLSTRALAEDAIFRKVFLTNPNTRKMAAGGQRPKEKEKRNLSSFSRNL